MSYKATNWAWEQPLKSIDKFVLVALADMADEQQSCFPSQQTLARMVGASEVTVRRSIVRLSEFGLLTREERRRKDGRKSSDRYFLKITELHRSNRPVGDFTDQIGATSPIIQDDFTGQSDRYIEEEPSVNHQRTISGARKRATRIPEPFMLTAEMRAWAAAEVPDLDVDMHTREFVDHWRAASGQSASKLDWVATWRNWMRKAHRWSKPDRSRTFAQQKQDNMLALVAKYEQEEVSRGEIGDREAGRVLSIGRGA